jgi:Ca2+-binding RTX toxin-like protein
MMTCITTLFFAINDVDASLSDLDNLQPSGPIKPETESPAEQSDEGAMTNDLGKPEEGAQTQDETGTETSQSADPTTSEKNPNLNVRPFINCDLSPSPSCVGTQMADTILGGKNPDQIMGLGGSDWINASGGNDFVVGAGHDDIIYGDEGNDILRGDEGSDRILGGDGQDEILGGPGDDKITHANAASSDFYTDSIDCGSGNDEVWITLGDHQKNCEKVHVNNPN